MSNHVYRILPRDSLFVLAELRLQHTGETHSVKVRNLSATGLMGEGDVRVLAGQLISVNLRNLGWVDGRVAWVQESRFGIAFTQEIDHLLVRQQAGTVAGESASHVRYQHQTQQLYTAPLRKI